MTDEHRNFGTIFNRTAGAIIVLTWVIMANHVEETTDKRTTWRPRKVISVEEMSNPFST
jgi:hypothetical protein